ncbi:uncharacterized protein [Musca autumnalis]|uniref:uncharacterized protein n=1 Tax=Musca autumnalis TaxID=221902 RepID=UPI003CE8CE61
MAKLDVQPVKKQKAKKRKNPCVEHEDEVANKSLILDTTSQEKEIQITQKNEQVISKKTKKRKNKDKGAIKEKRSKSYTAAVDGSDDDNDEQHEVGQHDNEDDDGIRQPTLEQLKECEKPENQLAIVTGRQKKKQKHQKLLESQKEHSIEKEKQRNEEYLNKWKHCRTEWKFEKLRQISIEKYMFDEIVVSSEFWNIALEYLAGSKGAAKDKVIKMANDVIDEVDRQCESKETDEERQVLVNSVKYQRARDLLQIFD